MRLHELRKRRALVGISGQVLCARAGISRSRLTEIERGYFTPREDELRRLNRALDKLIAARRRVEAVALEVGWPWPL